MNKPCVALACLLLVGCESRDPARLDSEAFVDKEMEASCSEHGLPPAVCTRCNPALEAVFQSKGDWCSEHRFPESLCPTCSPGAGSLGVDSSEATDWCAEHRVPESQCTSCDPGLIPGFQGAGDWCAEHGFPESACPVCNPVSRVTTGDGGRPGFGPRIRLRSPDIERAAGITTVRVRDESLALSVECTARLVFNQDRTADVRAPIAGVVREVLVGLGDVVDEGQALVTVASPRVGDLQGRLSAAKKHVEVARTNLAREESLHVAKISSEREVELAKQALVTELAEQQALETSLRIGGSSGGNREGLTTLRAPLSGTVVRRPVTLGSRASADTSLATIVDTSTLWGLLDVREHEVSRVELGQRVSMEVDGIPDQTFSGRVTWLSAEVDPRTRTVLARAELDNRAGLLRANQFARARVHVTNPQAVRVVPQDAVQEVDGAQVLFVRARVGTYDAVPVTLGRRHGALVEVTGPVELGDRIVTSGAFLLKTELMKDSIGAGCCDVDGPRGE